MNLLFIAYFFPPLGGAGVQRSTKFIKYLSNKGINVFVLTTNPTKHFVQDVHLSMDIPKNVKIIRSKYFSFDPLFKLLNRIKLGFLNHYLFRFLIPDPQIGWLIPGLNAARIIIKKYNIDVIFTTSTPYTAHLIGLHLKRKNPDLRWIADFRDPWSQNVILYSKLGRVRQNIDRKIEKMVLNKIDKIITVTPSCSINLINEFNLDSNKVTTITNGYDEADFINIKKINIENDRVFNILYVGSAYSDYSPGNFILACIEKLFPMASNLKLNFVGESSDWAKQLLKSNGLYDKYSQFFNFKQYVTHERAIELMIKNNLLVLVIPNTIPYNMTGKIFEYIRSGVPILACVPLYGDAAEVIRMTKTGFIVDPDDIEAIGLTVNQLYHQWLNGGLRFSPDMHEINKYRRDVLTDKLINVFKEVMKKV